MLIVICSSLLFSYLLTLGLEFLLILQGGTVSTPAWVLGCDFLSQHESFPRLLVLDAVMDVSSSHTFIIDLRDIWEDSEASARVSSTLLNQSLITAIF